MNKFYISSFSVSPWSEVGATGEVEAIKVYFPKFTVTSNNNKINKEKLIKIIKKENNNKEEELQEEINKLKKNQIKQTLNIKI